MKTNASLNNIALKGLDVAPSQTWGGVRLVPLLRRNVRGDLRLWKRSYGEDVAEVNLGGRELAPKAFYGSYVPHGLVVNWSTEGALDATFGTHLAKGKGDGKVFSGEGYTARLLHMMVKQEDRNRLRILPLHVAMEGFLALQFGGPDIAWEEYSKQALSQGLSPRYERVAWGWQLQGLQAALRIFEIHEDQVGVLFFIDEALASAFVVPHPDDYRALHQTLLEDFYGPTLVHAGRYGAAATLEIGFDEEEIATIDDLRSALSAMRDRWSSFQGAMADGLLSQSVSSEKVYRAGPFQLSRFMTELGPSEENHIGETIVREDGTLEYLKTYRLSRGQSKRAFLLQSLAKYNWNIEATAAALKQSKDDFILRIEKSGFGYLLKEHVLKKARSKKRRR